MKKSAIKNLSIVLVGYLLVMGIANFGAAVVQHMPRVLLFGTLATAVLMGYYMDQSNKKWLDGIFVTLPYIVGSGFYLVARAMQNDSLIKVFRKIMPQGYAQVDLMEKLTSGFLGREVQIIITLLLVAALSYGCVAIGMKLRTKESTLSKLIYNNVLLWGIHFYVAMALGQLVQMYPKMMLNDQQRLISGAVVTVIIFTLYFFIGRWIKSFDSIGLQLLSVASVTVTALGMYIGGLILVYPLGRYEVYILPVAHSFFGLIGQKVAMMLGSEAVVISQYGMVVSAILMIIPMVLVVIGNRVSRDKELVEVEEEVEVASH